MLESQQDELPKILGSMASDDTRTDVAHAITTCNKKKSAHVLVTQYGRVVVLQNDNVDEVCRYIRHLANEGKREIARTKKAIEAELNKREGLRRLPLKCR